MPGASQLNALAIRPDYTKEDCVAQAETVNRSSPEDRAVMAAWTRSKSLFSSLNNSLSRASLSFFSSAPFCAFKPFSSSFSSASVLLEALLEAILTTKRHSVWQTSVTPRHPPEFRTSRAAQSERSTKIYQVETVTSGQSGAAGVSETEHFVSTVLYVHECNDSSASYARRSRQFP